MPVLGTLVGALLASASYIGAGGIDNDSPFTLPAFAGGSDGGSSSGSSALASEQTGRQRFGVAGIRGLVPELGVGSNLTFSDHFGMGPFSILGNVKFVEPGVGNPLVVASLPKFIVADGDAATVIDSAPMNGDYAIEAKGAFEVTGSVPVWLQPALLPGALTGLVLIGQAEPGEVLPFAVEAVVTLTDPQSGVDVAAIGKALAAHPELAGKDATILLVRSNMLLNGKPHIKIETAARLTIGGESTLVDTNPKLPG